MTATASPIYKPPTTQDHGRLIEHARLQHDYPHQRGWWWDAAFQAIAAGRSFLIQGRTSTDPYLLRMWLNNSPSNKTKGGVSSSTDDTSSGQNSILLHYIIRPDDDDAMHDHPWDFDTSILCGAYDEMRPDEEWRRERAAVSDILGPTGCVIERRRAGEQHHRKTIDAHRITVVLPGTMTLVRTGPRMQSWGFWPAGKPKVPWRKYLGIPEKDPITDRITRTHRIILGTLAEPLSDPEENAIIVAKAVCTKCPSHRFQVGYGIDHVHCAGCGERFPMVPV